jgi:hypothetical protein
VWQSTQLRAIATTLHHQAAPGPGGNRKNSTHHPAFSKVNYARRIAWYAKTIDYGSGTRDHAPDGVNYQARALDSMHRRTGHTCNFAAQICRDLYICQVARESLLPGVEPGTNLQINCTEKMLDRSNGICKAAARAMINCGKKKPHVLLYTVTVRSMFSSSQS